MEKNKKKVKQHMKALEKLLLVMELITKPLVY